MDTDGGGEVAVLIARVADRRCAIPVDRVAEVHAAVSPTPLPGAPDVIRGMINRRGEPTPVMDLRRRLGLAHRQIQPDDRLVAVQRQDRPVALLVDAVVDIMTVRHQAMDATAMPGSAGSPLRGVAVLPDGLALIVDVDAFLSGHEQIALDQALAASEQGDG